MSPELGRKKAGLDRLALWSIFSGQINLHLVATAGCH